MTDSQTHLSDRWSAASTYEHFMGRWSRKLAREFVAWLAPAPQLHWLELGCGTGALTQVICTDTQPASVLACDPAATFVEYARERIDDKRATFVVAGAQDFPFRASGYDSITSLLALNFFPDPRAAVKRMRAACDADGTVSACVWDYAGGTQFLRYFWDAAAEVDPRALELDEAARFPICTKTNLAELFADAGFVDIRGQALEIATEFRTFEDYWAPLLGATGPAPTFVASLAPPQRDALRAKLDSTLPRRPDGTISLRARAWAIAGC